MAAIQYTFTHTKYTERHKANNIYNNTKILEECGPCPVFAGFTLEFALQLRKKHGISQFTCRRPKMPTNNPESSYQFQTSHRVMASDVVGGSFS